MKTVHWLTTLALFTASCDVILVLNFGGTIRFAQLMMLGVIVCALIHIVQTGKILWPRGGYALAAWCLLQGLLISQSSAIGVSIQLYLLLLFIIAGVYATLQLYGRSTLVEPLMKVYLLSFVFVAIFGLIQFVSPALHLGRPLVAQWIVHGLIPRINGFSYEPSYFATYLILGWIMLIDLRVTRAQITQSRRWFYLLLLVSLALFLSTSKTAWILMLAEGGSRLWPAVVRPLRLQIGRLRAGRLILPFPRFKVVFWTAAALIAFSGFLLAVNRVVDLNQLLAGTGINGTAAHSVNDRNDRFLDTLHVIVQHPFIGRSLGGVAGNIAASYGHTVTNATELRTYWGFPAPLDILAASGLWAFLPFLWFFFAITRGERSLIRARWADERSKWLHALIRALIFEWLALLADQNLLRLYFWFHVTMIVVVGYNLRYSPAETPSAESLVPA